MTKTKLATKPIILGWMSPANKAFRKSFPSVIEKLPQYSFLDAKSFKIDGYFVGENVGSVVLRVSDKSGTYVVKSTHDPKRILAEAAFLKHWKQVGANVINVKETVSPARGFPIAVAILEYISTPLSESELTSKNIVSTYRKFGHGLALLHRAKSAGFGEIINTKNLKGKYDTFGSLVRATLTIDIKAKLLKNKLVSKNDLELIPQAVKIVEADIRKGTRSVLIHNDPALFNTFGISSIKFFDPVPKISHPLEDVASALIWALFNEKSAQTREAIIKSYSSKLKSDDSVLQALMFLKILEKWERWSRRAKTEKDALKWIKRTNSLYAAAKKSLNT